ncbi:acyltransferase family protein [Gallibacterium anatis]
MNRILVVVITPPPSSIYISSLNNRIINKRLSDIYCIIFIIILFLCLYFYSEKIPYIPGIALLIPCFCTAGLIYFSESGRLMKKLLGLFPMVKIGLLSYSLYLWHWVVITFFHYVLGDVSRDLIFVTSQCILIFLFSWLGYRFIEKPIRYTKCSFKKSFILIYLIPSLLIVGINFLARKHIRKIDTEYKEVSEMVMENTLSSKVLMIGDSHSDHLSAFLNYVGAKEGWKADIINFNGTNCKFPIDESGNIIQRKECIDNLDKINKYPVIFVSFFYDLYSGDNPVPRNNPVSFRVTNFYLKFRNLIKFLAKDKQVYVFSNIPAITYSPLKVLHLKPLGLDKYLPPIKQMGDIHRSNLKIMAAIENIPNVYWVDIVPYMPKEYYINNKPIYRDQDHLTASGAYYIGYEFQKHNILLPNKLIEEIYKDE